MRFSLLRVVWLCLCLLAMPHAYALHHEFHFNYIPPVDQLPEHRPQVVPAGQLKINGVSMNAFNTVFQNTNEMRVLQNVAKPIPAKIKAEYLKRFDIYGMPNGSVFVPSGWRLANAELGNNQALNYTFVPASGELGYLHFSHYASCLSCAMINGSLFFEQALRDARDRDYQFYRSTNLPLKVVYLKSDSIAYSAEDGNYRIDGLVFYNLNSPLPYWKVEVSLPKGQANLANQLLNQFMAKYP